MKSERDPREGEILNNPRHSYGLGRSCAVTQVARQTTARASLVALVLGAGLLAGRGDAYAQGCGATPLPGPFGGEPAARVRAYGPGDATAVVKTRNELIDALRYASVGDVIYVVDSVEIDLTGVKNLPVQGGVTLASGRGRYGGSGALLYTNQLDTQPLFEVKGPGARFTGLRIRGPDQEIGTDAYARPNSDGIRADYSVEVENSELYGWTRGAIHVAGGNAYIHDNYIHHNRRHGLGYGVVIRKNAYALIEHNLFDANRHAIAGTGESGQGYEARYNVIGPTANGHIFDMHGGQDRSDRSDNIAGEQILIHHNTFGSEAEAVVIRGVPEKGAWIYGNDFPHNVAVGPGGAIRQAYEPKGNVWYSGNCYAETGWYVSTAASGFWGSLAKFPYGLSELRFGDFNGDGVTDVFRADGNSWYVSYGGNSGWSRLNISGMHVDDLAFADFNGDGITDVFSVGNGQWRVSYGAISSWSVLNHKGEVGLDLLRLGDFDEDGAADVFRTDGEQWLVSYGGASEWSRLADLGISVDELAFADFDGDGRTDVFHANGEQWLVSYGGTSAWSQLAASPTVLSDLVFGDVNGDGRADVIHTTGSEWLVSYGGTSGWETLAASSFVSSSLAVGDFNGDGRADFFRTGKLLAK